MLSSGQETRWSHFCWLLSGDPTGFPQPHLPFVFPHPGFFGLGSSLRWTLTLQAPHTKWQNILEAVFNLPCCYQEVLGLACAHVHCNPQGGGPAQLPCDRGAFQRLTRGGLSGQWGESLASLVLSGLTYESIKSTNSNEAARQSLLTNFTLASSYPPTPHHLVPGCRPEGEAVASRIPLGPICG